MIDPFIQTLDGFIKSRDGEGLASCFVLEPNSQGLFDAPYPALIQEVRRSTSQDQLESYCASKLTSVNADAGEAQWYDFVRFTATYLRYLTQVNPSNLLQTFNLLSDLVQSVICSSYTEHESTDHA